VLGRAARAARAARDAWAPPPAPPPVPKPEKWDSTQNSALWAWCAANGVDARPQYLWPVLHAAHSARALDIPVIAALEFGVAGGNGLLALERAAAAATELSGTRIEIFGFDTGTGMPKPTDPRDAPWLVEESLFAMDEQALRSRLTTAELVLGDVGQTVPEWQRSDRPPIGFVSFDLDYYTSTVEALRVLDGDPERLLPRVPCYFDDLFGYGWTDFVGERQAIDEFNARSTERKVAKIHGLRFELPPAEFQEAWHEKLYVVHVFDHPRYAELETPLDEGWLVAHRLDPG
jgi:hypothetical protein